MANVCERRKIDFVDFDQLLADASRLNGEGYQQAGAWDLAKVNEHIAGALNWSMTGFPVGPMPLPIRMVARWFVLPKMLKSRRMKAGFKAPAKLLPKGGDQAESSEQLRQAVEKFQSFPGPHAIHPFFGALDAEQWKQLHLIHAAHHFSFLVPEKR